MLQPDALPDIPKEAEVHRLGKEAEARWVEFDQACSVPADLYQHAAHLGLFRQLIPHDQGGLGATPLEWFRTGLTLARHETGSHTVVVDDQAIPAAWTYSTAKPATHPHPEDAKRYGCIVANGNWPIGTSVAATQLGAARRALEELVALLPHKKPAPAFEPLSASTAVQRELMAVAGLWHAARAGVEVALGRLWEAAGAHRPLDTSLRVELATANATANHVAVEVVGRACALAGTSMVPAEHPLNRMLRDTTTLRGHISTNAAVLEHAARVELGMEEPFLLV